MFSRKDLKELAARKGDPRSPVLSVFLNVDQSVSSNLNRGFEAALKNMIRDLFEGIEGSEQEKEFSTDAERVGRFINNYQPRARSLAIFCDASEDFLWSRDVNAPLKNEIHWHEKPYIRPLLEARDEFERYAVLLADKAQARLFTVFLGEIQEHQEAFAEAQVKHIKAPGSDHSRSQMQVQRKADVHVLWHLKNAAELLGRLDDQKRFERLVLAGPVEATSQLQKILPDHLKRRLIGTVSLALDAAPQQVLSETLKLGLESERSGEEELVSDLLTGAAKKERAVVGMADTMKMLQEGRVWQLVFAEGVSISGAECSQCELLFADSQDHCPYCSREVRPVKDLVGHMVRHTIDRGGSAENVRGKAADVLKGKGGVGAFLRF